MKGVLIGSDLMYRKDGSLAPIEINTNVGGDILNRVEAWKDVFNFDDVRAFVIEQSITKIALEGVVGSSLTYMIEALKDLDVSVEVISKNEFEEIAAEEHTLAIRTFYDDEALVDSFCRDKIAFLDSLKGTNLEVEYLLKTENGFEGEITTLEDNGLLPNFILKYRYPNYDKKTYPKFYRFLNMEQLEAFADSEEMPEDFFLMPFYYCPEKLYNGERIPLIRNWSVFVANGEEGLDSIYIGKYTKLCGKIDESKLSWTKEGAENGEFRNMLLSTGWYSRSSADFLADSDDLIWMADGTWKEAKDLEVGDEIKTVKFPEKEGVDITKHSNVDYDVTVEELTAESSYDVNTVTAINKATGFMDMVHMSFADGSDWYDTARSSYTVLDPKDGTVMFKTLDQLKVGDVLVLLDDISGGESPAYVEQEIVDIETVREEKEFIGLSCDNTHLFLSRTSEDAGAYISIEHNAADESCWTVYLNGSPCYTVCGNPGYCGSGCSIYEETDIIPGDHSGGNCQGDGMTQSFCHCEGK